MSNNDTVITVENLSKAYLLGRQEKQDTFFGSMAALAKAPLTNFRRLVRLNTFNLSKAEPVDTDDILWALKDVSFEVKRGECLGIIGRNGAGKSTLLKILSRIAEPTRGRIRMKGRVSALLEVGTGFHPELTGRENIYLNGTILGMKKAEIDRKFDEIVDFSGVERFLDTPVKRYSSGMRVRLAFSVAAHLEPEILIVDEVLAVGDAEFQKKCLGKMQDVTMGEGRTILFVSHNLEAVRSLCTKAFILENGYIAFTDTADKAVMHYLSSILGSTVSNQGLWENELQRPGVRRVQVFQYGKRTNYVVCKDPFEIVIDLNLTKECHQLEIGIGITDETGSDIIRLNNRHVKQTLDWEKKIGEPVRVFVPHLNWIYGEYVYIGVYFGYVSGSYQELHGLLKISLVKDFRYTPVTGLVSRVNKILLDGIRFS